jgi:NAD+ synthase (glutamine-hydrolysing)
LPFSATLADSMTLNICVAQLNLVVGDTAGNARQIIDAAHTAHAQGAHVLLTPELAVSGYAAEDLYLRPGFLDACDDALKTIALQTSGLSGLHIVVGHPQRTSVAATKDRSVSVPSLVNAASVLHQGRTTLTYGKRELPNYQVFDERRYFVPRAMRCLRFRTAKGNRCAWACSFVKTRGSTPPWSPPVRPALSCWR